MHQVEIWRTAGIIQQTATTITIIFNTNGVPFDYHPGQFINLTLRIDGTRVTRSYSLSAVSGAPAQPAITVKRVEGGIMSNYLLDHAASIQEWEVSGPHGSFTPTADTYTAKHVVLLAGGSGITPLYTIARSVMERSPDTKVTFIYASRTPGDIIFKEDLASWKAAHPERMNVHHAISAAGAADGADYIKGRLSKLVTRKLIRQAVADPHDNVHYFICGPAPLMKMHQEMLEALEVPGTNIFQEWFTPEEVDGNEQLPEHAQEVLCHFYEQTNLLDVDPGQTILEAALEDRVPLPYSCKGGTCGMCAAKLTAGKVKMRANYALRPSDIEEGMILLCQSYPLTADVTVEIGGMMAE